MGHVSQAESWFSHALVLPSTSLLPEAPVGWRPVTAEKIHLNTGAVKQKGRGFQNRKQAPNLLIQLV